MQAQGQTLEAAGLYLGTDFFSHGQVYVAFSRVGNQDVHKKKYSLRKIHKFGREKKQIRSVTIFEGIRVDMF